MGRKKQRKEAAAGSSAEQAAKGTPVKGILMAVVILAAVGLAIASWHSAPGPAPEPRAEVPAPPPALARERAATPAPRPAAPPSESASATPEPFRPVLGEWVRPDGGYVLAVQGVAEDGTATVGYFNPQPINVGTARASLEGGTLELFVKLDDRNYPGSTYTLKHDPQQDQLVGVYFQAVQRASYDVVFVRR